MVKLVVFWIFFGGISPESLGDPLSESKKPPWPPQTKPQKWPFNVLNSIICSNIQIWWIAVILKKKRTFHIEFCVKRIICLTSIKKKHQIPGFSSPGMEDGTRIAWTSMWQKTKGATWSWSSIFPGATKEVTKTHKQRPVGAPGYLMLFFLGVPIFYGLR